MTSVNFDKPRTLKYDWAACRDLENALGGKPLGVIVAHLGQVSLVAFTAALWAGFKHEDLSLTETAVQRALIEYVDNGGRIAVLGKAINDSLLASGILNDPDESASDGDGTVELDRVRHVKFSIRGVRMLEGLMSGMGIAAISEQISNVGANALTLALYTGLKSEDKDITPNLTAKIIESYMAKGGSVRTLSRIVVKAIEAVGIFRNETPLGDEDEVGNAPAAMASRS